MIDMIGKILKRYSDWLELIGSVLFIGGLFYLLYIALWVFCPCG